MKKYKPETKTELKKLVFTDGIKLNYVDTSLIKDMSNLFYKSKRKDFEGIEYWDVSNVTNMEMMFGYMDYHLMGRYSMTDFNPNLNNWNVSKVKSMNNMFAYCSNFDQPLDKWDVSNVEDMAFMFCGAKEFNQPLNSWDTSKVKNMSGMFQECEFFNQPLDKWDTSNVEDMEKTFFSCMKFNKPLNSWNVSNVENMDMMFYMAQSFNQPLDKWDTQKLITAAGLFRFAYKYDCYESLEHWNLDNLQEVGTFCDDEDKLHTRLKVYMQVFYPKENYITITNNNAKEIYNLILKDKNKKIVRLRKKIESDFREELSISEYNFNTIEDAENYIKNNYRKIKELSL